MIEHDFAVIGGGLVGASIAWGLARAGKRVIVLDEGDFALRASRGNFALVWVQSKGLGMPRYAAWTLDSARRWPELAHALQEQTGLDVRYERPGGFHLALSELELAKRAAMLRRLHAQPGMPGHAFQVMDHASVRAMLPDIGPDVAGGTFCEWDGHCNSLRLLRALHEGLRTLGVAYRPESQVHTITHRAGEFALHVSDDIVRAPRIVLAAGLGNERLAPMVGLQVPLRALRGQIAVTEKVAPFLRHPVATVRQTDEGGVMLGDSQEESGRDPSVGHAVLAVIADRAARMFPRLAPLNVVRTWAALRIMTPDGFPIYAESASHPGAFAATTHSGVTLAAAHALVLAPALAAGTVSRVDLAPFCTARFDVPAAA